MITGSGKYLLNPVFELFRANIIDIFITILHFVLPAAVGLLVTRWVVAGGFDVSRSQGACVTLTCRV